MVPAHERLDAGQAAGPQVDDRLEHQGELVEVGGALEVDAELVALAHRLVHPRVEDREAGLAVGLGHVHRDVGVAHEVRRPGDRVAGAGDADRRGRPRHACRRGCTARGARRPGARPWMRARLSDGLVLDEDRELVAAEPGHEVALADEALDPLGHRDEERVAGAVAERVVHDLEVVEVEEEDRRDLVLRVGVLPGAEHALEGQLEHAAVGRAGQRVALGEVLDVLEQHGIAQVQGRDRRELSHHRRDAPLDARPPPGPVLDDDGADRPAVRDHRRDEDVPRARQEVARNGSRVGSSVLDGQDLAALPGAVTIQSGSLDVVGASAVHASRGRRPAGPTRRAARRARSRSVRRRPRGRARPGGSASATVSSLAPTSTRACRSARRWRSSRSLSAEKIEVAMANSQNEVTLRTGIRSNSMPTPGVTSMAVTRRAACAYSSDEQQERMPQGDLQAGPVGRQERDRDEVEVDDEADRALRAARGVHRGGEVDAVDEQQARQDPVVEAGRPLPGPLPDDRDRRGTRRSRPRSCRAGSTSASGASTAQRATITPIATRRMSRCDIRSLSDVKSARLAWAWSWASAAEATGTGSVGLTARVLARAVTGGPRPRSRAAPRDRPRRPASAGGRVGRRATGRAGTAARSASGRAGS